MPDKSKHVSLRLPMDLWDSVLAESVNVHRSVGWVIASRLRRSYGTDDVGAAGGGEAGEAKRKGDRATVPILPKAKGDKKQLHPVHEVRVELERGTGDRSASVSHATHRVYNDPGKGWWCSDCGVHFQKPDTMI